MRTAMRKALGLGLAVAMAAGIAVTTTSDASAQTQTVVSTTGKGIAGGALLGGEAGFLVLSAAGARSGWLYATIPAALAIGGGIGGYYYETSTSSATGPMYMLAGGMALVIPTLVITLTATSTPYTPDEPVTTVDKGAKPGKGGPTSKASPRQVTPIEPSARSFALLNFDSAVSPRVSVPAVQVSPMYSSVELSKFGGQQRWQYNAPILSVTF